MPHGCMQLREAAQQAASKLSDAEQKLSATHPGDEWYQLRLQDRDLAAQNYQEAKEALDECEAEEDD